MNASLWNEWAQRWWDAAVTSTAQGLVLLAVVLALLLMLRRLSPLWRYALLLIVLAKLALPPMQLSTFSAFSLMARHAPEAASAVVVPSRSPAPLTSKTPLALDAPEPPALAATSLAPAMTAPTVMAPAQSTRTPLSPLGWLLLLHACGIVAVLFVVLHESRRLRRIRKRAQRLTGAQLQELASRLAARCKLSRVPALYLSSDVDTPQAGGLLRPFVILPAWVEQTSRHEVEILLAHELAHVARRDAWINWLQIVAQAWLWYNPAAWWINARIRHERELCCDDFVLGLRLAEGEPYGRALLAVAERMGRRHRLSESMGMAESFHRVRGRIERALNNRLSRRTRFSLASMVILVALSVWLLPTATPQSQSAKPGNASVDPAVQRGRELIYVLRHFTLRGDNDTWADAVRELAQIGKPAMPDMVNELCNPRGRAISQSTLSLALQEVNDPRAIPGLITAIVDCTPTSDFGGIRIDNPDLLKFMRRVTNTRERENSDLPRPVRAITIALEKISGHSEGYGQYQYYEPDGSRVKGAMYDNTPERDAATKRKRQKVADRWWTWWNAHKAELLLPAEIAKAERWPQFRSDDVIEAAGLAAFGPIVPYGPSIEFGPIIDATLPRIVGDHGARHGLDLDSGKWSMLREGYGEYNSAAHRRWEERNGIDVELAAHNGTDPHTLNDHDLLIWPLENEQWDSLPRDIGFDKPPRLPANSDSFRTTDRNDYPCTFLVKTRERTVALMHFSTSTATAGTVVQYRVQNPSKPTTAPNGTGESQTPAVEGKSFNIRVKDESGKPIAGAEVALVYFGKTETRLLGSTTTDTTGVASFKNLPIREPYSLATVARIAGKSIGSHLHYSLPSLRMRPFEITMVPSISISGEVSVPSGYDPTRVAVYAIAFEVRHAGSPKGPALPDSVVALLPWKYRVSLDKDGRYVLADLPSRGNIYLAAEGPGLGQSQAMLTDLQTSDSDVSMYPEGVIEGTLRDVAGQPVAGMKVRAHPHRTGLLAVANPFEGQTDADGRYRIAGLRANHYNVGIAREQVPPDLTVAPAMDVNVQVGQTVGNVALHYEAGVVVQGTVRDSTTSEPLAGADVVAQREGQDEIGLGSGVTDASGNYAIRVPAGQVRLYIAACPDGYTYPRDRQGIRAPTPFHGHNLEVREGEGTRSELDFVLDRISEKDAWKYTKAKGRVLDASGNPVAGIPIREDVTLPDGRRVMGGWLGETGSDGQYDVKVVVRGEYRIIAGGREFGVARSKPFVAVEDVVHEVEDLTVQNAPSFIAGRVTDREGNPIADASVRISSQHNWGPWGVRTDRNGKFRVDNLVPEPLAVGFLKEGYELRDFRDVEPGKADHVFVLEKKGGDR